MSVAASTRMGDRLGPPRAIYNVHYNYTKILSLAARPYGKTKYDEERQAVK